MWRCTDEASRKRRVSVFWNFGKVDVTVNRHLIQVAVFHNNQCYVLGMRGLKPFILKEVNGKGVWRKG